MLACFCCVGLDRVPATVAAAIVEAAAALDVADVFGTAAAIVETTTATDTPGAGIGAAADVAEAAAAADASDGDVIAPATYEVAIDETATATDVPDATKVSSLVPRHAMVEGVFINSDGTARQANAAGVMVNL